MNRYLVLFAREPRREAREKGLGDPGEDLFATFAAGWLKAARSCGARLVIATPPEDRRAWIARLPAGAEVLWIAQRGRSFGQRLEAAARCASALPGHCVLVGGDVAPISTSLSEAFEALDGGAQAVLGPAADGGVSLVALEPRDLDLLNALAPRQRAVFETLERRLRARGRAVAQVMPAPDVDGRRSLRLALRRNLLTSDLVSIARRVALLPRFLRPQPRIWSLFSRAVPTLRGPPLPA